MIIFSSFLESAFKFTEKNLEIISLLFIWLSFSLIVWTVNTVDHSATFTTHLSNPSNDNRAIMCIAIDADWGESSWVDVCERDEKYIKKNISEYNKKLQKLVDIEQENILDYQIMRQAIGDVYMQLLYSEDELRHFKSQKRKSTKSKSKRK